MRFLSGLFGGGAVDVALELDRSAASAGEEVSVAIRVGGRRKDVAVDEGRCELVLEEEYEWRERESHVGDDDVGDSERRTSKDELVVARERFLDAGTIGSGSTSQHTVTLRIPAEAAPTAAGEILRIRWLVRAVLARSRASDPEASRELTVASTRDQHASWAQRAPDVDTHGDLELSLELEGLDYGPGDTVEGMLLARALGDCAVDELRVELERNEHVPRGDGNEHATTEARATLQAELELTAGAERSFPFRLRIPVSPVACARTEHGTIRWRVRGVGARRMRSDYNVTRELNVYSAGAAAREPLRT